MKTTKSQIEKIIADTHFVLRTYKDGNNRIQVFHPSNGKQMNIKGDSLTEKELEIILAHPKTKFKFKENIGKSTESKLFLNY